MTHLAVSLLCLVLPAPALAQAPAVTLSGRVVDAVSGEPVAGVLVSVGDRGPRSIADPQGRFRISDVPTGRQRLHAERFGYRTLEISVTVADPPQPVVVRMEVDPIALEGLTVTGGASVALGGTVTDAETGDPVPWAEVLLSRDTQRRDARATADAWGIFSLPAVTTGTYFLRVERLGYESQYLPVELAAPPLPVDVRLRPDPLVREGLAKMDAQRTTRLNSTPFTTRRFDEVRLRQSRAPGMRHFLEYDASMALGPCQNAPLGRHDCMEVRNRQVRPFVFIDEMPATGLDHLDSYLPSDLYSLEYILCSGLPVLRAYTFAYMERVARRPVQLIDACNIPPLP
jgi:hypothetical protein